MKTSVVTPSEELFYNEEAFSAETLRTVSGGAYSGIIDRILCSLPLVDCLLSGRREQV